MIQYRVMQRDIEGGLGLALAHPLFYLVAILFQLVPMGDFAFKVNMVSAIAAAFAVANLFLLCRLWLNNTFAAFIGALSFALSHTFWRHASLPETYTMYTALLLAELVWITLYLKDRKAPYLYLAALCNGLAIAVHMLAIIPLACYLVCIVIWVVKKHFAIKQVALTFCCWCLGASVYLYLIIKQWVATDDLLATLKSAAFGTNWQQDVLNATMSVKIVKENILFFMLNFPTPNILLVLMGIIALIKTKQNKTLRTLFLVTGLLFLAFAGRYTVPDRYAFFIPFYAFCAILIAHGIFYLRQHWTSARALATAVFLMALLPAGVYATVPKFAESREWIFKNHRQIPYRNNYTYFLQPWKTGYLGADRFASEVLEQVAPNAVLYADGTTLYPLLIMQQLKAIRSDVTVVADHGSYRHLSEFDENHIDQVFPQRPVYTVSDQPGYCHPFLKEQFILESRGLIFQATAKNP